MKAIRLMLALAGTVLLAPSLAYATAPPVMRESVALCDPNYPARCSAPDLLGSLPVNGNAFNVQVTPTVTAVAFTAGWAIGGLQPIQGAGRVAGGTGILQDVEVMFKSTQTAAQATIDIFLFSDTSLASTCTNAAAFVLSATDFPKLVGVVQITTAVAGNTTTLAQSANLAKVYTTAATTLYACAVARGTPTWGTTSDLTFSYNFIRN